MPSDNFYIDASVIALGFGVAVWAAFTHDMTLFAIGCLIFGSGLYEMGQRFNGA